MNFFFAFLILISLILIGISLGNTPPWYASSSEHRQHRKNGGIYNSLGTLGIYLFLGTCVVAYIFK